MTDFYRGKRVFVTGHTGFKGAWLCRILKNAGAIVTGYSLAPNTTPNLFTLADTANGMTSIIGDVRDFETLHRAFLAADPQIVFHLAAQPIVRESYRTPRDTYEINVMGTVNLFECIRKSQSVLSVLNVTTDKVYENFERAESYREDEKLDGFDPYSNSKSCSELVTHCYCRSFFADGVPAVSTARAGNVIGGGDFAADRIVPDCVRAALQGTNIAIRNPHSTRPYQHVLEPLFAYLMIAQEQYLDHEKAGWYNVGPDDCDCFETGALVDAFLNCWGEGLRAENHADNGPHEASFLKLDNRKLKETFDWSPCWNLTTAIRKTVDWTKAWRDGDGVTDIMDEQIRAFQYAFDKQREDVCRFHS
ncbi:MAG TPA: CDP-glucose 4,6-dehydratase [Eubacteriales bacterium]|nr:CDP-glucose 4,6-dehydratase [Clostridia bacterium]HRV73299.1 CDP-glucose 4,6-dehydratase [Eubacteriales bacterium]